MGPRNKGIKFRPEGPLPDALVRVPFIVGVKGSVMSEAIPLHSNHPLVGSWQAADDFSDMVVSIVAVAEGFSVSVTDQTDGEVAEVFEPQYDGNVLSFSAHWPSNGRFIKYRFLLQSEGTVGVTYTYSGQEVWQRKLT